MARVLNITAERITTMVRITESILATTKARILTEVPTMAKEAITKMAPVTTMTASKHTEIPQITKSGTVSRLLLPEIGDYYAV